MDVTVPPVGDTKYIRTPDGRDLAYVEFGDHDAPLVIHNHGGPSSRLEGRLLASAATGNGLRLVSVDRPGVGRSSPQKDRTYHGWADDLLTIADALGYAQFGVSGWSEGGPWALAAAAYAAPHRRGTRPGAGPGGEFGSDVRPTAPRRRRPHRSRRGHGRGRRAARADGSPPRRPRRPPRAMRVRAALDGGVRLWHLLVVKNLALTCLVAPVGFVLSGLLARRAGDAVAFGTNRSGSGGGQAAQGSSSSPSRCPTWSATS
jgi:pimeloyl-ACP methyl ester carboxylesterase